MPNRILRDGFKTSKRVTRMSFAARYFWFCLVATADDYGRYEADIDTLRPMCLPHDLEEVSEEDVRKLLAECTSTEGLLPGQRPLVRVYEVNGKKYLELDNYGQKIRAKYSKFPDPPDLSPRIARAQQMLADASRCDAHVYVGRPTVVCEPNSNANTKSETKTDVSAYSERMYARHPRKKNKPLVEMEIVSFARKHGAAKLEEIDAVHAQWCASEEWQRDGGRYVPSLDRWLSDEAWTQSPPRSEPVRTMPVMRDAWGVRS